LWQGLLAARKKFDLSATMSPDELLLAEEG
jgi:hypothetical protein